MSSIGGKGENKDSSAMKCGRVGSCPMILCRYERIGENVLLGLRD